MLSYSYKIDLGFNYNLIRLHIFSLANFDSLVFQIPNSSAMFQKSCNHMLSGDSNFDDFLWPQKLHKTSNPFNFTAELKLSYEYK